MNREPGNVTETPALPEPFFSAGTTCYTNNDPLMDAVDRLANGCRFRSGIEWYRFDFFETCNVNVGNKGTLFAVGWNVNNEKQCIKMKFFLIDEWV